MMSRWAFLVLAACGGGGATVIDAAGSLDSVPIDAAQDAGECVSLSPGTFDFGTVAVNHTNAVPAKFTISNACASAVHETPHVDVGDFTLVTTACPTIGSHEQCVLEVNFAPTTVGQKVGKLYVDGDAVFVATLSGNAAVEEGLSLDPTAATFDAAHLTQAFTIANNGTATQTVSQISLGGANPSSFAVSANSCGSVAPTSSCSFTIAFTTGHGDVSATVAIATTTGQLNATLMGTDGPAQLVTTKTLVDYGTGFFDHPVNVTHTFENAGLVALPAIALALGGSDASSWAVGTDGCTGTALAPGATCDVIVGFMPHAAGSRAATLTATAGGATATVTLLGTCCGPGGITVTPTVKDFGNTDAFTLSPVQTFTIVNSGGVPTSMPTVSLTGNDPGQFKIASTTCTAPIAAGGTCTVDVAFAPTSYSTKSASLTVVATSVAIAGLSGVGVPGAMLSLAPASHDFGPVGVGTNSSFFHFTVTNDGGATSAMPTVALGGANATQFSYTTTCTAPLAPGATCDIAARFSPNIYANAAATVAISAGGAAAVANVFGQGAGGSGLFVSSTILDFGMLAVGATAQLTLTVSNLGIDPTGVPSVIEQGEAASDYAIVANTCTAALAPNDQCMIGISSTPSATGKRTANVVVVATPGGVASTVLTTQGI